ncbi:hypothetical protein PITCH_A240024 [uncultured Desulfobacterium sp.]|uniref:Uncharacterized protein n=1 Tax=uncultured Desulfobacterium sp. TaxID=201089 RepID=A0A445MYQ7_9BACT|nr:hypothetical protein PITCH_A240024 [uncultured Desulfobacterium sp.]
MIAGITKLYLHKIFILEFFLVRVKIGGTRTFIGAESFFSYSISLHDLFNL